MPAELLMRLTQPIRSSAFLSIVVVWVSFGIAAVGEAADLPATIKAIKPSIVAVVTYQKTRSPPLRFVGTGFAVVDGLSIITNDHVIKASNRGSGEETLGILSGDNSGFRPATAVVVDEEHDLARVTFSGTPLPVVGLGDADKTVEGQRIAFTGFPMAPILGFHPATHEGIISCILPMTLPVQNARQLDPKAITQLRRGAFPMLQLDATAYPGNSGSPVYDPASGLILGVINMVLGPKETASTNATGITYAIPVNYVQALISRK